MSEISSNTAGGSTKALLEKYFPQAAAEDRAPTLAEFRERVKELHEADAQEEASGLLAWYAQEKESQKKPESRLSKAVKITAFVLAVLAGILGTLWFFEGRQAQSDTLVVCSIAGVIHEGKDCIPEVDKKAPEDAPLKTSE